MRKLIKSVRNSMSFVHFGGVQHSDTPIYDQLEREWARNGHFAPFQLDIAG